jgi:DNA-binding MarR family transcriptional regulator
MSKRRRSVGAESAEKPARPWSLRGTESNETATAAHIDDSTGMQIVHALRAVTVELNLVGAEFAAANGLHLTDLRALIELLDAERAGVVATPGLLGERLGLNSASVTALVDRLERLGHVSRRRDATDRRRVLLDVTPAAKDLGWAFFGPLMASIVDVLGAFDDDQQGTVRRFLESVRNAAAVSRRPESGAGPAGAARS